MSTVRLTKNSLRDQQKKLQQLQKYLPTLQLKKGLLQMEVNATKALIIERQKELETQTQELLEFAAFFAFDVHADLGKFLHVAHVGKSYENIAGVEIPIFGHVEFAQEDFFLFDTPIWFDSALFLAKAAITIREKLAILEEKKRSLEKELREVSIRVNLFEKVLIPRCKQLVKKIRVFLGDQELSAVSQAKVAKKKIEEKREAT